MTSTPWEPRIVTADDLCLAVEATLLEHLGPLITATGADVEGFTEWRQVPDLKALQEADLPAGAITSPGLADTPTHSRANGYNATWQIVVGVFDRGSDHDDTSRRTRTWAGLVRAAVVTHPRLGGLAQAVRWVGEDYTVVSGAASARTLGACAVSFNVTAQNVVDVVPPVPVATVAATSVSIRPRAQE